MTRALASGLALAVLLGFLPVASGADTVAVSGVVRTADGKGIAGVAVAATYYQRTLSAWTGLGSSVEAKAASDANGRFTFSLPEDASSVTIRVEVPPKSTRHLASYQAAPDILDIVSGTTEPSKLTLLMAEGGGVLTGKVTDEAGKPVKDATVEVSRALNHPRTNNPVVREVLRATTGADGVYRFDGLVSGDYTADSVTPARGSGLVPLSGWRGVGGAQVIRAVAATKDFTLVPGGFIRGRVVDEAGKPLAGMTVRAGLAPATIDGPTMFQRSGNFADQATTDKDGRYALVGLSPETYQVTASGPEGSNLAPSGALMGIRVEAGKTESVQDLALVPGGSLKGKITGADGKPVAGVTVIYDRKTVETGADGTYRFAALPTGVARLTFLPPRGSVWAATTVEDVACVAKLGVVRNVALEEGGVVAGQVRSADGNAVPNATVGAYCGNHHYAATSDKDGKFRLVGLVENKGFDYQKKPLIYSLVARPPADSPFMGGSVQFSIKPGQKLSEDLVLDPGASVRVKATTPDGKPVAGASVAVFVDLGGRGGARSFYAGAAQGMGRSLVTGADGTLLIRQLPQGVKDVSVDPPDGVNLLYAEKRGVNLVAGDTTLAEVVLKRGSVIRGVVVDEKGKPVAEAEVRLSAKRPMDMGWGQMPKPATTGDDGRYEFAGLPAGGYQIETHLFDGTHVATSQDASVAEGKETETKIVALVGGFIEVKVAGPDGKAVVSFGARASGKTDSGAFSAHGSPNKSGAAVMGPLVPGTYTVTVTPYGGRGAARMAPAEIKDIVVGPGERVRREASVEELPGPTPEELELKKKREMEGGPSKGGKPGNAPTGVMDGMTGGVPPTGGVKEQVFEK